MQRLARQAIEPFYDATLELRTRRVIGRWQRAAQRCLEAHPAHYAVTNLILHARAKLAEAAAGLERAQQEALKELRDIEPPGAQLRIGYFGVLGSHRSRCFPRRTTSSRRPRGCARQSAMPTSDLCDRGEGREVLQDPLARHQHPFFSRHYRDTPPPASRRTTVLGRYFGRARIQADRHCEPYPPARQKRDENILTYYII